jgi:hypothetical protein
MERDEKVVWKDVECNNNYEVSNTGYVRNKTSKHILSFRPHNRGYSRVAIGRKDKLVHRLVAIAFIDNPYDKYTVNHKDGNKSNNNIDNLEWATYSEQEIHAYDIGLKKRGSEHHSSKKIRDTITGTIYGCIKELADDINTSYNAVKNGLRTHMKGIKNMPKYSHYEFVD